MYFAIFRSKPHTFVIFREANDCTASTHWNDKHDCIMPFVGRFERDVLEERQRSAQDLLNFVGQRHYLIQSKAFKQFFKVSKLIAIKIKVFCHWFQVLICVLDSCFINVKFAYVTCMQCQKCIFTSTSYLLQGGARSRLVETADVLQPVTAAAKLDTSGSRETTGVVDNFSDVLVPALNADSTSLQSVPLSIDINTKQ